jgi:peptide-methionine (S)-S-oxide reductase
MALTRVSCGHRQAHIRADALGLQLMFDSPDKTTMPTAETALPGRRDAMPVPDNHYVSGNTLVPPFPPEMELAVFAMGCFWGTERSFWELEGVYSTHVGYCGGFTPNPTYQEVCTGCTGHAESVRVVFNPAQISYRGLLKVFWESHDPTQGMGQGNDIGSAYRSCIFTYSDSQAWEAQESKVRFQSSLEKASFGEITTQIAAVKEFYYAEEYHQQYLAKNPQGYCGVGKTGVCLI